MQSDGSRTQLLEGPPPGARVSHVIARLHRASCIGEQVDLLYKVRRGFLYVFAESSRLYLRHCSSISKYAGERENTHFTRARCRVDIAGLLSFRHSRLASALV